MKYSRFIRVIFIHTALLAAFAIQLNAATMGISGGYDLDALWSQAREQYELSGHDAVLLLESRRVSISTGGDLLTRVHRVVWIGTEVGIDDYADLRIPYNSATSTFTVTSLRTWRDGRWWPHEQEVSETAVVETLPFEMARADDYTSMRETMLLHDGIELPCIMETAYEIVTGAQAADGSDGMWIFPQHDPAHLVEYVVKIPEGKTLVFHSGNGAPEPVKTGDGDQMATYTWKMENVAPSGSPRIADAAAYAPYVSWSTWPDWITLGRKIVSSFNGAVAVNDALADTLAARLEHEPSPASKARAIAALVNEYTRTIHYSPRFWRFSPRPATRTWETAYGHALDRAVLAAALFRAAGLDAEPLFRSAGLSGIDNDIPGLSRFDAIAVSVSGSGLQAFYAPSKGTLYEGTRALHGLIVWKPETQDAPPMTPVLAGLKTESRFELIVTLEPAEDGSWRGTGYLRGDGVFCPYDRMAGLRCEALAYIKKIVGSVFTGADVTGYNPETFAPAAVAAGFDFTLKTGEPDDRGRTGIVIGDPTGGIMDVLPSNTHLYHEHRTSPVVTAGTMKQHVRLRIKTGEREIVYLPKPRTLDNDAGRFTLSVEQEDGWVMVDRELTLKGGTTPPGKWPLLRALLLEETDAVSRTIFMK